jgi:hypothetical protein
MPPFPTREMLQEEQATMPLIAFGVPSYCLTVGSEVYAHEMTYCRPLLEELKDQMVFYLDFFVSPVNYSPENDHEYPDNAMGYLALVSDIALHRLPEWQNPILNKETRADILEKVAQGWQMAVYVLGQRVQAGKVFPPLAVKDWARALLKFAEEIRGECGMRETCESFMQSLGWLFGKLL